jgi:hypothetical protein
VKKVVFSSIEVRFEDQGERKSRISGGNNQSRHVKRPDLCESDVFIPFNVLADTSEQLVERVEIARIDARDNV